MLGLGQFDARLLRRRHQELMRHLEQHARAVAGIGLGSARTTVIQIGQDLQALLQDLVRFSAFNIYDKADAASVVLVSRIIKTLLLWTGGSPLQGDPVHGLFLEARSVPLVMLAYRYHHREIRVWPWHRCERRAWPGPHIDLSSARAAEVSCIPEGGSARDRRRGVRRPIGGADTAITV